MIVEGKGTVQITLNEVTYGVGNVYFVPALKNNLLSVGQLQEKGLSVVFKGDICTLYHPMRGKMAQTKMRANRMFTLISEKPNGDDEKCLQTTVPEITKLWHERYGHLSYKGLNTLQDKTMVIGLPKFKAEAFTCVDCLNGRQTRNAIPKQATWRANNILELIHSDLCGPISPTSNSGKRYVMSFIDDFSRKAWVYLLANKSDALECFKQFACKVENERNASLKCLRTDRGGEYTSSAFNEYCRNKGIKR
ncbi:hypothetical protein LIER_42865 [Lithospermum erythrorhizon]|uniref:Integrase catalytic domain-containing protein n=1 Tax=Lithospermum erythrorhizon TaxID=34254 RepID=A0AAV3P5K4_LITER